MKQNRKSEQRDERIIPWKSLYFRIFLFVLLYSCVFLFMLLYVYRRSYHQFRLESTARADELTDQVRMNIGNTLASIAEDNFPLFRTNETFGALLGVRENNGLSLREEIQQRVDLQNGMVQLLNESRNIEWIALADAKGNIHLEKHSRLSSARITGDSIYQIYEEKCCFLQGRRGHTYWFLNPETGNPILARAIFDYSAMRFTGYLLAEINPEVFKSIFKNLDENYTGIFGVYGIDGRLFYQSIPGGLNQTLKLEDVLRLYREEGKILAISYPLNGGEVQVLNLLDVEQQSITYIRPVNDFAATGIGMSILLIAIGAAVMFGSTSRKIRVIIRNLTNISEGRFHEFQTFKRKNDELSVINTKIEDTGMRMEVLLRELIAEKEKQEKKEYELLNTRFHELQSQVNPHFLFNSLQAINGVVLIKGDREASRMIGMLARFLRGSLERKAETCRLREEIQYVKNYLELCKTIYPDRLELKWDLEECLNNMEIPTFILQPIVENSVMHGMMEKIDTCTIEIRAYKESGRMVLSVYDDGVGIPDKRLAMLQNTMMQSKRIGLSNVRERLQLVFGEDFSLKIKSKYRKYTLVKIILPMTETIDTVENPEQIQG